MTTCATCGRHTDENFAFCPYCGAPSVTAAPTREQRKRVTILFCDVTGSTALGESTDPEALRALLARYYHRMKGIIESHGGTVEKFIGDAVMAVFGVPVVHEDDAIRAIRAASDMQGALPELGVMARIGVQTGEVVTGTEERLATGDAVNVAARLEQAAPPGEVLLGEETVQLARDAIEIEAVEPLQLKGKSDRVPAYRLLAVRDAAERRQSMTPMIGRGRELRRLQDSYAQAGEDSSCQLFTILGTAGVGKSRLAAEFLRELRDTRIVRGRCLSYGEGITYWPVTEVLTQLDAMPRDEYAAATLKFMLGEKAVATSPDEIAWAFRSLLEEQAQDEPLVVVFDDIHWGEETFLDLIEHIADLSRDAPILLLCMARPELLEKRPGWGGGKWNATTVLLEPLNGEETDRLLDELGGASDELRERIRVAAEGNPFYVEEMLALIKESGGREIPVPPTIQALLAARLDQLGPEERNVLECGSVEGRVFHTSAVQLLSNDAPDLHGRLTGLVRKELVRRDRAQLPGDEAYRFRHLLIRDAAYDALPKAIRAALHEKFAGWLEERGTELADLDEIVGYHLEQAARCKQELGQPDPELAERAGERLGTAGRQALWRGDVKAATGLLERALSLLRPIRWDVSLELDLLEGAHVHMQERVTSLEAISEHARAAGDACGEAVARVMAADARFLAGHAASIDELEMLAGEAIPLLGEAGDHDGLVRVWLALSSGVGLARCRYEDMAHAAEQAIHHARQIGKPGLFGLPSVLMLGPRPADQALSTLELLLEGEVHPGPSALLARSILLAMLGRFEEAQAEAEQASERSREVTGSTAQGLLALAEVATCAGDYKMAAHSMRLYCDWLGETGNLSFLSTMGPRLGRSLCELGRYDEAEPLAQQGRDLGTEDDVPTQSAWRQVQARVLAHRGEHQEAERLAREAVAIVEPTDALNFQAEGFWDLAEVLERAGREQEARATLEQALDRYERKKNLAMAAQVTQRLRLGQREDSTRLV